MQVCVITGNLGRDPENRSTQGGDYVLSFSVGVQNGFKRDAGTNWYRCSVWGQRGKTLADHLRKGMRVTVIGALTIGEYQGKTQFDVNVTEVDFTKSAGGERQEPNDSRDEGNQSSGGYDLETDSVPF